MFLFEKCMFLKQVFHTMKVMELCLLENYRSFEKKLEVYLYVINITNVHMLCLETNTQEITIYNIHHKVLLFLFISNIPSSETWSLVTNKSLLVTC